MFSQDQTLKKMRVIGLDNALWAYKLGYEIAVKNKQRVGVYQKDMDIKPSFEEVLNGTWYVGENVSFN
jgi:hypothetical protein